MKTSRQRLEANLSLIYTVATNIGHVLLISGDTTNEDFTTDFATNNDRIIVADTNVYGVGARLRFNSTGTLPGGLTSGVDYWVGVANSTELVVYETYDNFVAGAPTINLTSDGTGTHSSVEQTFSESAFLDGVIPFSAIANKEITHADYTRRIYNYPSVNWDNTNKEAYGEATFTYTKSPSEPPINYRYACLAIGSNSTIGNSASGVIDSLHDFVSPQSITTAQAINVRVSERG